MTAQEGAQLEWRKVPLSRDSMAILASAWLLMATGLGDPTEGLGGWRTLIDYAPSPAIINMGKVNSHHLSSHVVKHISHSTPPAERSELVVGSLFHGEDGRAPLLG